MKQIYGKYVCDFLVADSVRDTETERQVYNYYGGFPSKPIMKPEGRKFTLELPVSLNDSLEFGGYDVEKLAGVLKKRAMPLFADREEDAVMLIGFRYEAFDKQRS